MKVPLLSGSGLEKVLKSNRVREFQGCKTVGTGFLSVFLGQYFAFSKQEEGSNTIFEEKSSSKKTKNG